MSEKGFDVQNKSDKEKIKVSDEMTGWYRNPMWLQTMFIGFIFLTVVMLNWSKLSTELTNFIMGLASFRLVDLFALTFILLLMFVVYFFLVTIWTGNITNKLIYAKLMKKRTMWHLGEDNLLHLYLPDTTKKGWWTVKGVGSFQVVKEAMFWIANGSLSMITVFNHPEGVNINDIKEKAILKIDPKRFENRNTEARLEAIEAANNPLASLNLATLIPLILIIGVAAYLIIGQMQTGECQSNLVKLAAQCGEVAKTTTEVAKDTPAANILSTVTGKGK